MAFRLRFPTLFDSFSAAARIRAPLAGLVLGLLAGCESPNPHSLIDAEPEPARPTEPAAQPPAPAAPSVYDSLTPGSGVLRLPFSLQSYGM